MRLTLQARMILPIWVNKIIIKSERLLQNLQVSTGHTFEQGITQHKLEGS